MGAKLPKPGGGSSTTVTSFVPGEDEEPAGVGYVEEPAGSRSDGVPAGGRFVSTSSSYDPLPKDGELPAGDPYGAEGSKYDRRLEDDTSDFHDDTSDLHDDAYDDSPVDTGDFDLTRLPSAPEPLIPEPKVAWKAQDDDLRLRPEDTIDMKALLRRVQPKLVAARDQVADQELDEFARSRRNKLLRFNGQAMSMPLQPEVRGSMSIPKVVIVTGHAGYGGNIQVNGIYSRYPLDCEQRPVYYKILEKRAAEEAAPRPRKPKRGPGSNKSADMREFEVPRPQAESRPTSMQAAHECWFLFYKGGYWIIGPEVARPEDYVHSPNIEACLPDRAKQWQAISPARVYARCPGVDCLIPDQLVGWETWDIGRRRFRTASGMSAVRGGTSG